MKFHHCLFKILKNQNVAEGWSDNVKTVYPPHKQFAEGYNDLVKLYTCESAAMRTTSSDLADCLLKNSFVLLLWNEWSYCSVFKE